MTVPENLQNSSSNNALNKLHSFKDPSFKHSAVLLMKKRIWKNLKQVFTQEKNSTWPSDFISYSSISAPPPFRPAKKYSDVSGFPALYTDPLTKLRFSDSSEFNYVRTLPMDIVNGLLELRKANTVVG